MKTDTVKDQLMKINKKAKIKSFLCCVIIIACIAQFLYLFILEDKSKSDGGLPSAIAMFVVVPVMITTILLLRKQTKKQREVDGYLLKLTSEFNNENITTKELEYSEVNSAKDEALGYLEKEKRATFIKKNICSVLSSLVAIFIVVPLRDTVEFRKNMEMIVLLSAIIILHSVSFYCAISVYGSVRHLSLEEPRREVFLTMMMVGGFIAFMSFLLDVFLISRLFVL